MAIDPITAAAAAKAIEIGTTAITGGMSAKRQYKYSEKLAKNNYARQLEAWNLQNEYNTPSNQLDLLKQAGLSPGMMYSGAGSGAATAGGLSSVSSGSGSTGYSHGEGFMSNLMSAMQLKVAESQIDLNHANAENARADASTKPSLVSSREAQTAESYASAGLRRAQTAGQELQNDITQATQADTVEQAQLYTDIMSKQFHQLVTSINRDIVELGVATSTADTRVATAKQAFKQQLLDYAVAQTRLELLKQGVDINTLDMASMYQHLESNYLSLTRERLYTGKYKDILGEETLLLTKDRQWYDVEHSVGLVGKLVSAGVQAYSAGKVGKAASAFGKARVVNIYNDGR